MERRTFLAGSAGLLAVPLAAAAQPSGKVAQVGILAGGGVSFDAGFQAFRQKLRELGYVEGRTVALVVRNAEGRAERYSELATELVQLRVDVIVVQGNAVLVALRRVDHRIPVVMAAIGNPVGAGFVASLSRPGGNVTGLSNMAEGLSAKWVQLLKEVAPTVKRVAVLRDPHNAAHDSMWTEIRGASRASAMTAVAWEARGSDEIERAFAATAPEHVGGLIVLPHPVAGANLKLIARLAAKQRLPAMYLTRDFPEAGGLISYGPNIADLWVRVAVFVDKILRGANPGDLPVEQPTRFELAINSKTAKALGLAIPQAVLARADEVIQ
jgi:putative ABC transport system substrate-binding protein